MKYAFVFAIKCWIVIIMFILFVRVGIIMEKINKLETEISIVYEIVDNISKWEQIQEWKHILF